MINVAHKTFYSMGFYHSAARLGLLKFNKYGIHIAEIEEDAQHYAKLVLRAQVQGMEDDLLQYVAVKPPYDERELEYAIVSGVEALLINQRFLTLGLGDDGHRHLLRMREYAQDKFWTDDPQVAILGKLIEFLRPTPEQVREVILSR